MFKKRNFTVWAARAVMTLMCFFKGGFIIFDEQNKSKIRVYVLCRVHTKKLTTIKVRKILLLDKNRLKLSFLDASV